MLWIWHCQIPSVMVSRAPIIKCRASLTRLVWCSLIITDSRLSPIQYANIQVYGSVHIIYRNFLV